MIREAMIVVLMAALGSSAAADDIVVGSASEISAAMQTAQPGDVLVMSNGFWTDQAIRFQGNGTAAMPITLRAETPGSVILNGTSGIEISGSHLVVDGLYFKDGVLDAGDHVVQFRRGSALARNCRLTNTVIENVNNPDIEERFFWVSIYGTDNVVDHCRFDGFVNRGVTMVIWGDWPNRHIIEHNHFVDRPEYQGPEDPNGFETVRIGTSDVSMLSSQSIVRNNLFERCDGEAEIVSNKSYDNSYLANTFLESKGTLTLRHGNNAVVKGNFFIGNGVSKTGGVRIIGENHVVQNNYFEGLDGRAGGVIVFEVGKPNAQVSEYFQVKNAMVSHNTIVNADDYAFQLDAGLGSDGRTLLPENCVVANNAVSNPGETLVQGADDGIAWVANQFYGGTLGLSPTPPGISTLAQSPVQVGADGLYRPGAGSPLLGTAATAFTPMDDMDGQARTGAADVGSDEVSGDPVTSGVLTAADVGPIWNGGEPQPEPVDSTRVIPAELPDAVFDPDGDGQTWTVVAEAAALTGSVLKSPPTGGATTRPGEPHDAIARFTAVFNAADTYTLYVRSRGFSTSTDSYYVSDDHGIDPEVNQGSSSSGAFRWDDAAVIAIASGDVGEARFVTIGKREPNTEIDALVLSSDGGLSDAELDALVLGTPVCEADLDRNGVTDYLDYRLFLDWYGQGDIGADLDGNGLVDQADHGVMAARIVAGCP